MKRLIAASLVLLAVPSVASAEEVVREIVWSRLDEAGELAAGEVLPCHAPGPAEQLKIENAEGAARTVTILKLENPSISTLYYALEGRVRYEDMAPGSYLEMWSSFEDGGMYFSRTLGDSGPMQSLSGSSDWRRFSLPFFSNKEAGRPTRIVVNVVFAGQGTVYLSPINVVQYAEGEQWSGVPGAWWNDRTGGLIGGVGGIVLGLLGALVGTLCGLGKARQLVMGLILVAILFGAAALAVGIVALALGQPYGVWYPLLLGGGIAVVVFGALLPVLRRRYEQVELRKMAAMDLSPAAAPHAGRST